MSGSTVNKGYPYPLTTDFADVQDPFRLALAVDADLRADQSPFRAFEGKPSFVVRQTSNGSGFLSGTDRLKINAIDWDNTGGAVVNNTGWFQPTGQAPSWWLFGATILTVAISGTPVVGDLVEGRISVSTTDQVSGLSTTTYATQRNDESNTNGEWLNVFTMAAMYQGNASAILELNGSTQKAISAGSTFWGLYLGPVT
jgi:hypothetical protein